MTQQEAVAVVAGHIAGQLQADEWDFTGHDATLTDADVARVERAVGIVARRLYRMGTPPREGEPDRSGDAGQDDREHG
jgi:hypothetical protein